MSNIWEVEFLNKASPWEVSMAGVAYVQADWRQSDSEKSDFVKNRTHYLDLYDNFIYTKVDIEEQGAPYMLRNWEGKSTENLITFFTAEKLRRINKSTDIFFEIKASVNHSDSIEEKTIDFENLNSLYLDSYNYYVEYSSAKIYFILNRNALVTGYRDIFPNNGIYVVASTENFNNFSCVIGYIVQLDQRYIPETIARKEDLDGLASEKYVDDAIGAIDIPEQLQADWNQTNGQAKDFIKNKPLVLTYTEQNLTDSQQKQARNNIKAGQDIIQSIIPHCSQLNVDESAVAAKVDITSMEAGVIYGFPVISNVKQYQVDFIVVCDDGSEYKVYSVTDNMIGKLFMVEKDLSDSEELTYIFTDIIGGYKYVIDVGDKSTSSKVSLVVDKILTINNTDEYFPVEEYNPATKKYVDEAISDIDIPEQVQSNWNQNDSTKPEYINNRTHWVDDDGTVHKLDQKFLDLPDNVATTEEVEELISQFSPQPYMAQSDEPTNKNLLWLDLDDESDDEGLSDAIEAAIADVKNVAIPIPDVAEVGQTIVVKEVDRNGRPVKWEAADLGKINQEQINQAISDYLEENPISGGEEKWEYIDDLSVVEDEENPITSIVKELGGDFKKIRIYIPKQSPGGIFKTASSSYTWETYVNERYGYRQLVGRIGVNLASNGWVNYLFEIEWVKELNMYISRYGVSYTQGSETFYVADRLDSEPIRKLTINANFATFNGKIYGVRA